ncbi:MAG: hypothetical protein RLZZ303_3357, partial [Candidatus Hydrogenedentota bacterium]
FNDLGEVTGVKGTLSPLFNGVGFPAAPTSLDFATAYANAAKASRYLLLSLLQLGRTEYADGRYYKSVGDLISEESAYKPPAFGPDDPPLFPLSNNSDAERRAQEVVDRFRRIASSITVRSDVYEVIATVQSGYGIDANNDGRYNYRDPSEFITTAESRTRMVYERRAPADNSDIADVSKQ